VIYPSLEDWQQRSSQARELRLDPERPVAVGARQLRVRGSIDSIDRFGTSLALLTDYKRRSFPERKNQLRGIAPQLSFYAYAFHAQFASEDASIADLAVGYWSILNGSWELLAAGSRIRDLIVAQNLGTKRCASLEELCTKMTDLWLWRLEQIEASRSFAYDPSDCRQCPSKGICRKNDPGEKPYQKGLSTLNARYQTADEGSNEDESAESL
jgi:hypothetical protein